MIEMPDDVRQDILERIADLAKRANIAGQTAEGRLFQATFETKPGRKQHVFVTAKARIDKGSVINIMSIGAPLRSGVLGGASKDQALELLRRNDEALFGRYSLLEMSGKLHVASSMDALLDYLHPVEFLAYLWAIAVHADEWEEAEGLDRM